jgi:sphingomyelin phosphodiesterase 2
MTGYGLLNDSWLKVHRQDVSAISAMDRIRQLGITCNSTWNTWRANREESRSKRLDYIFVNSRLCEVTNCRVFFTELVPKINCSYSDHFGVNTRIRLGSAIKDSSLAAVNAPVQVIRDNPPSESTAAPSTAHTILSRNTFEDIGQIAARYLQRETRQSKYRIVHFFAAVFGFLCLLVGQWWVKPAFGHFLILLGTVLIMCYGVVDGLIGFIFMRWEVRCLKEFISEMALQAEMRKL